MISVGIITVSDRSSRGEREDLSGPEIKKWAEDKSYTVHEIRIVADEIEEIKKSLVELSDKKINLIFTTGGTGFAPRDVTPEATKAVIEKETPGIPEAMRAMSMKITDRAMLSRASAGIRKSSLIINLPGSPKAVRENLGFIEKSLSHAVELLMSQVSDCGSL
jgi:molybdenum cofactor synthesis domain-containing protein